MDNVATIRHMLAHAHGETINTKQNVRKCEEIADKQARDMQKIMRCYNAKRCARLRCGACGR